MASADQDKRERLLDGFASMLQSNGADATDVLHVLQDILLRGSILAVSGGMDSMFLMHLLNAVRLRYQGESGSPNDRSERERISSVSPLTIFHLNHGLRPEASLDEQLVLDEARKLDLPVFLEYEDTAQFARKMSLQLEEAGRFLRHRSLFRAARLSGADFALTGHHGNDYIETMLMRQVRASAMSSTEILPFCDELPVWSSLRKSRRLLGHLKLMRPLLFLERNQIQELASNLSIPFVQDASNDSVLFQRNRIRASVVPVLEDEGLRPGILWIRQHDWNSEWQRLNWKAATIPEATDDNGWVKIPEGLWKQATDWEMAAMVRSATRRLNLNPPTVQLLKSLQSYRSGRVSAQLRVQCGAWEMWSAGKGLWIYPRTGGFFSSPRATRGVDHIEVQWLGQKRKYRDPDLRLASYEDVKQYALLDPESGVRKTGRLKTIYQKESLPPPVRSNIPILTDGSGLARRLCLSFLEGTDRTFFLA
ncbi:MAG: tRNA lysidine(34) synthetase TilS [Leptospiraceae bacterium]|nr:tRNA lysidine(34) synthetase TilS [Leptospiraceae bacterium]